jgi:glutathione S-transferase
MSYPLLRISGDYALVEVRKGRGSQRWDEMAEIFNGPASQGQEWKGGEGDKLSARHCMWPDDPASTRSLPYTVAGTPLLDVGKPKLREFPTKLRTLNLAEVGGVHEEPLVLHEYAPSGNCYKIRLTAALLGLDLERRSYDILQGETRTAEFLRDVNANGRIPVLQMGDRFLPESNAACFYLADGSELIPEDRFERADMLRWMFWEQYNHEPNVATYRYWMAFVGADNLTDLQKAQVGMKKTAGDAALKLMDERLERIDWLVGGRPSLADISLYAYTHLAEEGGGFDLSEYPAIGRWLERVTLLPGYITIID